MGRNREDKINLVKGLMDRALDYYEEKAYRRVQLMTHEQRQALIQRPITFNYYGGKGWGGVSNTACLIPLNIGGGLDEGTSYERD